MNRPAQLELVGRKIRQLRRQRKLTQVELAEKIGVHQSDLSRMEQGEYKVGLDTLLKILQCFDLSIGEFFDENRTSTIVEKYRALSPTAQKEVETFIEFKRSQETSDVDGSEGGGTMSETQMKQVEELRQSALGHVRQGEYENAIVLYDEALAMAAESEETRELLTINKADALIALERSGPEVNELPRIIMRPAQPLRHVYLAAYALQYKHRLEGDLKRALFYGQLALRTAEEANETSWRRIVLGELGNIYELDSQIPTAIECFQKVLLMAEESAENKDRDLSHAYALENLGYCLLLQGNTEEGLLHVHEALEILRDPIGRAEAFVDLCFGYLEKSDYERARSYGEAALEIARDARQIRNAHYLTGEACYKAGDAEGATAHFDALAKFYPQFRNLKSLLFAIDLRSMVNLKL